MGPNNFAAYDYAKLCK